MGHLYVLSKQSGRKADSVVLGQFEKRRTAELEVELEELEARNKTAQSLMPGGLLSGGE